MKNFFVAFFFLKEEEERAERKLILKNFDPSHDRFSNLIILIAIFIISLFKFLIVSMEIPTRAVRVLF